VLGELFVWDVKPQKPSIKLTKVIQVGEPIYCICSVPFLKSNKRSSTGLPLNTPPSQEYESSVWLGCKGKIQCFALDLNFESRIIWEAHGGKEISEMLYVGSVFEVWSCSNDPTIEIWDAMTRQRKRSLNSEPAVNITCMGLLRNQYIIAGGPAAFQIVVWHIKTHQCVQKLQFTIEPLRFLAFHTTNSFWAGARDLSLSIWEVLLNDENSGSMTTDPTHQRRASGSQLSPPADVTSKDDNSVDQLLHLKRSSSPIPRRRSGDFS